CFRIRAPEWSTLVPHSRGEVRTCLHRISDRHPSLSCTPTRCVRHPTAQHKLSIRLQPIPTELHQACHLCRFVSTTTPRPRDPDRRREPLPTSARRPGRGAHLQD